MDSPLRVFAVRDGCPYTDCNTFPSGTHFLGNLVLLDGEGLYKAPMASSSYYWLRVSTPNDSRGWKEPFGRTEVVSDYFQEPN